MLEFNRLREHPIHRDRREFVGRAATVVAIVAVAAIIWYVARVLLLAFAGILLAVLLDFLADQLAHFVRIRRGIAFFIVVAAMFLAVGLAVWYVAPRIANQVSALLSAIPAGLERLRNYLAGRPWGQTLVGYLPNIIASADLTGRIGNLLRKVFEGATAMVVVVVLGLYLGAAPGFYRRGLLKLVRDEHRAKASDFLAEVAYTLRWWIIGQMVPMGALGIATIIGLSLMHVPLAFTLGLFTGLMVFIPYIGSLIAWVTTVVVVLIQGVTAVLYVSILFIAIHIAEGYFLTPLVQRRAVYLPPGLTILSQVFMGILLGFFGLAMATPITAAALVTVRMLYLHERPEHHD